MAEHEEVQHVRQRQKEVQIFAQANQNTGGSDAIKTRNKS